MNCERVAESLIAYLDGRASRADQRALEAHAAVCAECRARIEEFRRVSVVLDELPRIEPSGAFDARVRQRIAAEPRSGWFGWLVPAPRLAFSLAFLLALSIWTGRFEPKVPEAAAPTAAATATAQSEQDFRLIKDLDVLENYDVVKNFDALSELPAADQSPAQANSDKKKDADGHI